MNAVVVVRFSMHIYRGYFPVQSHCLCFLNLAVELYANTTLCQQHLHLCTEKNNILCDSTKVQKCVIGIHHTDHIDSHYNAVSCTFVYCNFFTKST